MKRSQFAKVLDRVRTLCLALPEVTEVEAWGHPTFRAGKKMFAGFGEGIPGGPTLGLKVGFDRQDELLNDPRFFPTPYAAHQGWVSLKLEGAIDWELIKRLIREAYQQVALKRMLQALDNGQPRRPTRKARRITEATSRGDSPVGPVDGLPERG